MVNCEESCKMVHQGKNKGGCIPVYTLWVELSAIKE